jgi:hypothetical protein
LFEWAVEVEVDEFVQIIRNCFRHKIPKNTSRHFADMHRSSQQVFLVVHVGFAFLNVELKLSHHIFHFRSVVESNVDESVSRIEGLNAMGEICEFLIGCAYDAVDGDL